MVVPGFGGFVTNERSARIDRAANSFHPPCREVGFNARLDHNDGLLISYLSARLSMNYVDAKKLVESFSARVQGRLLEGSMVHFEGIGQFSVDRHGNMQFDPDPASNFLTDAYGLSFFRYPPLHAGEAGLKARIKAGDTESVRMPGSVRRLLRYAAVGIPLIAALSWGAMNTNFIREFSFDISSLNPFAAVVDSEIRELPVVDEKKDPPPASVADALEDMTGMRRALMYEELTDAGELSGPAAGDAADGEEAVAEPVTPRRHHIIAGSFSSMQNAGLFKERMEQEGYSCQVIESENELYRVSLFSSENSGEALQVLRRVRAQPGTSDAWMLSR